MQCQHEPPGRPVSCWAATAGGFLDVREVSQCWGASLFRVLFEVWHGAAWPGMTAKAASPDMSSVQARS